MAAIDRETETLLRAVVNRRPSRIIELATEIKNWNETIEVARRHGILPILYTQLVKSGAPVPPEALAFAKGEFERNAFHCMTNAAELLEVLKTFEAVGIPAVPFKGVVLAASVYKDISLRSAGDLDVLVFKRDLAAATEVLISRGYRLVLPVAEVGEPHEEPRFEYHFERESDGMVIELRWRLDLKRFRRDLGMEWVWSRRKSALFAGAVIPELNPETCILLLCMHGSKHTWSRLIWVCDVARLIDARPDLDWNFVIQESKRVGLWRCLAVGVLLACQLVSAEIPAEVSRTFAADKTAVSLAAFLADHLLEEPGKTPDGLLPYNVRLLGYSDRLGMVFSPSFLRPNARDRAVIKLPAALEPLYYVVRPFRVLFDRSGR